MTSHSNKLMRVSEVADLLGVSRSYVYKLAQTDPNFLQPIVLGSEHRPRGKDYDSE